MKINYNFLLIAAICLLLFISTLFFKASDRIIEISNRILKKKYQNPQKLALQKWAESLDPETDYDYNYWRQHFHSSSTTDFFNGYGKKLSKIFQELKAKVNFAMIGACDGTSDNTIRTLFLPNDHWRGIFVEPMNMNVRDLIQYMSSNNVSHRSVVLRAAATSLCANPTIVVERPMFEEKNASLPHWLRRQIGSVLPQHRDHARKGWTTEEVRCVTSSDILTEWLSKTSKPSDNIMSKKKIRTKRRVHILKIDVEGHDYEVLMSFMAEDIPPSELPLLIDFEAKSIAKKYPAAKLRMEERGYVVSPFGQDGFAMLKAENIYDEFTNSPVLPKGPSITD